MTIFTKVDVISTGVGTTRGLELNVRLLSNNTTIKERFENLRTVLTAHNRLQNPEVFKVAKGTIAKKTTNGSFNDKYELIKGLYLE